MRIRYAMAPAILLVTVLLVTGCGGDDDPASPGGGNGGGNPTGVNMSATVDGGAWQAVTANAINNSGIIAVGSSNVNGDTGIGFGFQDNGTGTYTIGPGQITNANITSVSGSSWSANGGTGSGSIVVTTLTADRIAGTFQFTAERLIGTGTPATRVVTNGTFDLEFQK